MNNYVIKVDVISKPFVPQGIYLEVCYIYVVQRWHAMNMIAIVYPHSSK